MGISSKLDTFSYLHDVLQIVSIITAQVASMLWYNRFIFDSFDFQALDPQTNLLFVAHTGPVPDGYILVDRAFDSDKDSQVTGNFHVSRAKTLPAKSLLPLSVSVRVSLFSLSWHCNLLK